MYRGSRGGTYYCIDSKTGKRVSLQTADEESAQQLVDARNNAARQPEMNLQLAQVYLRHSDPALSARTWLNVMEQMKSTKTNNTLLRWEGAIKDSAFDLIRHRKLIETTADDFFAALKAGTVSTNVYLRRIHNFAVNMHWLPLPVLPKPNWPLVKHKEKRAIIIKEHQKIINCELNPATRAYYELLWHLGGAQSDTASLTGEDINWKDRTVSYGRKKTGTTSLIPFGNEVASILKKLPATGELFPALARIHEKHRAKMFVKRLMTVGITGVSLHSYRYAWAERAMEAGYPERFAMQALGHSSKAMHRAYAKKAQVTLPPLENYEQQRSNTPMLTPDVCRN